MLQPLKFKSQLKHFPFNIFLVGKAAVELSAPLFRFAAMTGDTDGMYSYGKLLESGQVYV